MPAAVRNTVDRLDKPSAYYQNRVSYSTDLRFSTKLTMAFLSQNRRGKYDRNDGPDDKDKAPEDTPEDPLRDATIDLIRHHVVSVSSNIIPTRMH